MSPIVSPRARSHADANGDPLDGLVNLFDLAIVLSVAFLLAALSSLRLSDVLTRSDITIIRDPGRPSQAVVVKEGDRIRTVQLGQGTVVGRGSRVGSVYRLADGRLVFVSGR